MRRALYAILLALSILAVTAGPAHAQASGSIFGKVTDDSGGLLPGVTVTISGSALQQPMVAVTTATGAYQFPTVPIGTYTVTFELASFKKASRPNVQIVTGFNAEINQKLAVGQMSEELTVTAASPVVDTKKTTTGATFDKSILENIPTARDPWQIINMTPGVRAGLNVGGSASGQQVGLTVYGTSGNVQWNLEGGNITDLSSNSSAVYYNFDAFEQIQVQTGGGDVSVQSSGLFINLVAKSGSNVFKGSAVGTYQNDAMQGNNVSRELFAKGTNGFISGAPIKSIGVMSIEYGGPIKKNRLWWWAMMDKNTINAGVINFFNAGAGGLCSDLVAAQRAGSLAQLVTFDGLQDVQKCLSNDQTVLKNTGWKVNYQLNAANRFQYLFTSDLKYRNARGASPTTLKEATTQQTSDEPWGFPLPIHRLTHTWVASDKMVFNNDFSYTHGGFYLDYQDVPPQGNCENSRYLASTKLSDYPNASKPDCLFSTQSLINRTTSIESRSLGNAYETRRYNWEAKTDATYFLSRVLGGDHSLKFGAGWRRAPVLSYSHTSGGARARLQCVGNAQANCGGGAIVAPGATAGYVPFRAELFRTGLVNNDWWTYNGYIQDSYSRGRWKINGGLRWDWQRSKYLGGCVPENPIVPDLLPGVCEGETDFDVVNNKPLKSYSNLSPRVSAIYDLFGDGKTAIRASGSYYYQTRINLANSLSGLGGITLTWGDNQSSGLCSTTAGASCWNDANRDSLVQRSELIGTPTANTARFNTTTNLLDPVGNSVHESAQIGRTREFIAGVQHELMPNLAVSVEYVYRKYDNGTAGFNVGFAPGQAGYPITQIYTTPVNYTDPVTGYTAPYYTVCQGCVRPSGLSTITMTRTSYEDYQGVNLVATKRFSDRWQLNANVTLQKLNEFSPVGSFTNPTGVEFDDGTNGDRRYLVRVNGSYQFNWGIMLSGNWIMNDGPLREFVVNGPGQVYGGTNAAGAPTPLTYTTLEFQERGATRRDPENLLDLGVAKTFSLRGGKNRLKLNLDIFNALNAATITGTNSNNLSLPAGANGILPIDQVTSVVPPRVFRIGATFHF